MNDLIHALERLAVRTNLARVCDGITFDAWKKEDHPRGQPGNKGQFVKKGASVSPSSASEHGTAKAKAKAEGAVKADVSKTGGGIPTANPNSGGFITTNGKPHVFEISDTALNPQTSPWNVPSMPDELAEEIAKWKTISKSPYSDSFYDSNDISWDHKPDGSLRVADHWNFTSRGEQHCITDKPVDNVKKWTVARYDAATGKYHVLKQYDAVGEYDPGTDYERPRMWASGKPHGKAIVEGLIRENKNRYLRLAAGLVGKDVSWRGTPNSRPTVMEINGDTAVLRTKTGKNITANATALVRENVKDVPPAKVYIDGKTGEVRPADEQN